MSARGGFRGGSSGGFRGSSRGGSSFGARGGGRGGGRGGFGGGYDAGPPSEVLEIGAFVHACEGEMSALVLRYAQVPYFNAPIYLQNKSSIGKVDEILGPINAAYFTIKTVEGVVATSFKAGDKFYIAKSKKEEEGGGQVEVEVAVAHSGDVGEVEERHRSEQAEEGVDSPHAVEASEACGFSSRGSSFSSRGGTGGFRGSSGGFRGGRGRGS
ncbi:MAG: H/ACA snoRNP pseudouridylase subunit [Cyphobasidiales sp. Tagirdzhanova-0007]|nr:MAG: H/ACA snoRNP pseudouridylase subunit [Cyphobasidiales sp. Tagirdzhanova-0007]